jgi:hypothetical protein
MPTFQGLASAPRVAADSGADLGNFVRGMRGFRVDSTLQQVAMKVTVDMIESAIP